MLSGFLKELGSGIMKDAWPCTMGVLHSVISLAGVGSPRRLQLQLELQSRPTSFIQSVPTMMPDENLGTKTKTCD